MIYVLRIPHQRPPQTFTAETEADVIALLSEEYGREFETAIEAAAHDMYAAFLGESVGDVLDQLGWLQHQRFKAEAAIRKLEPRAFRSELTAVGEQFVIPGCEEDDERTGARQINLF